MKKLIALSLMFISVSALADYTITNSDGTGSRVSTDRWTGQTIVTNTDGSGARISTNRWTGDIEVQRTDGTFSRIQHNRYGGY